MHFECSAKFRQLAIYSGAHDLVVHARLQFAPPPNSHETSGDWTDTAAVSTQTRIRLEVNLTSIVLTADWRHFVRLRTSRTKRECVRRTVKNYGSPRGVQRSNRHAAFSDRQFVVSKS
jgi:hypothetical protein